MSGVVAGAGEGADAGGDERQRFGALGAGGSALAACGCFFQKVTPHSLRQIIFIVTLYHTEAKANVQLKRL
ncbi:hypothetical protein [Alkalilimnicola ehrlichii]|uniref:hypothetical protein n=1 Tax=Alkalilimnicola ehrlichii TaxID=351052 RepID=UPI0011C07A93|nr:hypothetical protein [Alkalilimnicola ehrlichii]